MLEYIMPFGMYKGKSLQDILEQSPGYLGWLSQQDLYYKYQELNDILANKDMQEKIKYYINKKIKPSGDIGIDQYGN